MKPDRSLWCFAGFALTSLGGTLLHFAYDWTNQNRLAALFSAVNESTWEHMKLLFFPLFFFALMQSRFFRSYKNFWCIKSIGTFVGLGLIPVLFYTANGAFGKTPDWFNITIFFITAAIVFLTENYLLRVHRPSRCTPRIALTLICGIGILFAVFTFFPPQLPLFQDPITGTYGIPRN